LRSFYRKNLDDNPTRPSSSRPAKGAKRRLRVK
jgi:hypothetical protein